MELPNLIALSIFFLIPISILALWFSEVIVLGTLITALLIFAVIFIVIPVVYRYSYVLQRNLIFLNFYHGTNLDHPQKQDLYGSQNYRVKSVDNVTLGLWHILPSKLNETQSSDRDTVTYLNNGEPIVIYLHGNSGNRGTSHRVHLYKILQENNFHVIAFDYRSYGDSSSVDPTEDGVVSDSRSVYYWVKEKAGNAANIYVWGHSLGTGIASHLLDILEKENETLTGLILESPFNNMSDEIRMYPLARFFKYLPWFDYFFITPVYENGFRFQSDAHLSEVLSPILILHAEDDIVVPFVLGEKLYERVRKTRDEQNIKSPVKLQSFPKSERLGHKYIYKAKNLTACLQEFVRQTSALRL